MVCRLRLKCDGKSTETRFRLSAKRTGPFKSEGASVQSTTGSRGVRISGSNAGYTNFRGSAKGTGYPLHSPVSPSLPLPCVTVCNHVSTGLYLRFLDQTLFLFYADCMPGSFTTFLDSNREESNILNSMVVSTPRISSVFISSERNFIKLFNVSL